MKYVHVEDTDACCKHALELESSSLMEPGNQFWGERNASIKSVQGVSRWLECRIEKVGEDEMALRSKEWTSNM